MNKKVVRVITALLCVLVLPVCFSCSKADSDVPSAEENLPDMILYDASYTFGRPDNDPLVLNAQKIAIYANSRTVVEKAVFTVSDELDGSCDRAESSDDKHITLEGNVHVFKKTDNLVIDCDNLVWDDETRSLSTQGLVHVVYEDGTKLSARGFRALPDTNEYEFDEIIEGVYTQL